MTEEATMSEKPLPKSAGQENDSASAPDIDLEKGPLEKVLAALGVDPDQGLGSAEAAKRLDQYGPNAIVEKEQGLLSKLLGHFTGPIAYMIEAAAIVKTLQERGHLVWR
jgi:H+-transporting ATPase